MEKSIFKELKNYKYGYKKRLEISAAAGMLFLMLLFYVFPVFVNEYFILPDVPKPRTIVISIPRTIQRTAKRPPRPQTPAIPIPSEDFSIPDDITLEIEDVQDLIDPGKIFNPDELEGLPYIPRQVLEVLPEKCGENIRGEIMLSLHIDKNGRVKSHEVIKNTTGSHLCLNSVIRAAYGSRWQPVIIDSNIYEYRIYKSYHFE